MKLDNVFLRRLEDNINDYKLLEKWYQEEVVYLQFEQRKLNLQEIKKKYYPRTLENTTVPVYMIEYNDIPVGIIQYKLVDQENKKLYGLKDNNIYELDIFIGSKENHNKGIGYKSILIMENYLFEEKKAKFLVMCPLVDNYSAIRCYQKCGFVKEKIFTTENTIGVLQEYVLMIKNIVN